MPDIALLFRLCEITRLKALFASDKSIARTHRIADHYKGVSKVGQLASKRSMRLVAHRDNDPIAWEELFLALVGKHDAVFGDLDDLMP